jgi:hypothetical protein
MIMSYKVGDVHPKRLYDLPTREAVDGVQWLLLSPSEETLFFLVEQGQNRECSSMLIAYNLQTDQARVIPLSCMLAIFQCPAWVDHSTLLVLTLDAAIGTLDIQNGRLTPLLDHVGYFTFSESRKLLLINTVNPKAYLPLSTEFVLYEFPSLKLLRKLSLKLFQRYEIENRFYFTDENHVLFSLRVDALMGFGTVWFDLRSFDYSKITGRGFISYVSTCPSWGFEVPSHDDDNLIQKVKDRLRYSASHIPMLDFVSIAPGERGVIRVFGTLQSEEDIATVLGFVKQVSGVKHVVSHIEVGNYQWMYEQKIEVYLKWGYESYELYDREDKQRILHHLNEYLFYRDHIEPSIIRNVEKFREALKHDIEKKT